jgi:mannose-6-phosphate isomerase
MVWGGRRLESILGQSLPSPATYGEAWVLSDHPVHQSAVATANYAGKSLRSLMEKDRERILGPAAAAHEIFPWLIKFLDCEGWLSVQVHPDEDAIRRLGINDGSKTEAWFVLEAAPGSQIYAGLRSGVDASQLRRALETGTVTTCLHHFEPRPGDCVFLPAGSVHAVGGGVLMAEVQQTSDATLRLFDWGRPRTLHIDQALSSIHWDRGPIDPVRVGTHERSKEVVEPLVRCPYFHLDYIKVTKPSAIGGTGQLQALIVLEGSGELVFEDGVQKIVAGQVWLMPASLPQGQCRPQGALKTLLCTLP